MTGQPDIQSLAGTTVAAAKTKKRSRFSRKQVIQACASLVFFVGLLIFCANLISMENARERIIRAGAYGPMVLIVLKASTNVIAPLGGNPIYLSAAPLFGFTLGFVSLIIGDLTGYTLSFYLSRLVGRRVAHLFFSDEQIGQLDQKIPDVSNWKSVLVLAGLFISFSDFASYGAGLTPIPFWKFFLIIAPVVVVKILVLMILGEEFVTNETSFVVMVGLTTVLPVIVIGIIKLMRSK
jgi:uncharacterized membrane protein YdjX (TVP38/TMEM64 family)